MRGTPVFKGSRVPVRLGCRYACPRRDPEEILEGYPTLNEEMISLAPLYMRVFPVRPCSNRDRWHGKKVRSKSLPFDRLLAISNN
jgi:hypothetical protein